MTILEAAEHTGPTKPVNAEGGFYVHLRATRQEIATGAAMLRAEKAARKAGWSLTGRRTTGFPVSHDDGTMTQSFWFHQIDWSTR